MRLFVIVLVLLISSVCAAQGPREPDRSAAAIESGDQGASPIRRAVRDTSALAKYVVRVSCANLGVVGTGFIHLGGRIVTAAHVVAGCPSGQVQIHLGNRAVKVKKVISDAFIDLALLDPAEKVSGGLVVGDGKDVAVGDTVVTWGFPVGYLGLDPLVSVGYLSGIGPVPTPTKPVTRAYVNGAFNLGNSGGPLIDVQSLTVVGVVDAKMAPVPQDVEAALAALGTQNSGFVYTAKLPNGKEMSFSEAQVVARVLAHLQQQTQLVVGLSVLLGDLRAFLKAQGVQP